MRVHRAGAAAAVATMTAVSVFVAAGPASADYLSWPNPGPVSQTSSMLAAEVGTGATAGEAVAGVTGTAGAGIAVGDAIGVGTLGTAGVVAAGGAWIGTSAGNWLVKILPGHWATTSGSFACDVQWAFNSNTVCAQGPAPSYVPNSDVIVRTPGWSAAGDTVGPYTRSDTPGYNFGNVFLRFSVVGSDYGFLGPSASVTAGVLPGYTMESGQASLAYQVAVYLRAMPSGTVVKAVNGGPGTVFTGTAPLLWTVPLGSSYTSYTMDHVEVTVPADGGTGQSGWATGAQPKVLDWYPVGNPLRPPVVDPNPTRTFQTDWRCSDGSTHSASSASFSETATSWPGIPSASCSGAAVAHVQVWETSTAAGGTRSLWTWDAPAAVGDALTQHPQCAGGGCQLLLQRIDSVTGAALDCFSSSSVCQAWWTETSGATTNTDAYRCTYGGDVVALSECTVYAHAFDPQNPTYADPRNGDAPAPAPDPNPAPQDNCPPPFSWAGLFNPWWYFQGGLCAMRAAFVPSAATSTAWQGFVGDVSTHPPVSVAMVGVQFTTDVTNGVHGAGDCSTLPLQMADTGLQGGAASFDLCAAVKSVAATSWGQAIELIVTIAIVGTGAWILMHRIGKSFGSKA